MLGMAHLCEHILFSSVYKTPFGIWSVHKPPLDSTIGDESAESDQNDKRNNYMGFVKSHSGSANAFTLANTTCYHFDIVHDRLCDALKLFSDPFKSPDFLRSFVADQIKIVDSEYRKNCESDSQRLFQVFRSEALEGHPWRRFTTGNEQSLSIAVAGVNSTPQESQEEGTCDLIKAWWEKHYDPRKMALAILGRESLDELSKMAYENFRPVGKDNPVRLSKPSEEQTEVVPPLNLPSFPIPWGTNPHEITFIKRIAHKPTLEVSFCLPDQDEVYKSKPAVYACYLISSEGLGTLSSYLKSKELITHLTCTHEQSARGFSFVRIKAELTKSGFGKSVVTTSFSFLNF
jgi:insulysin